jgi:hypothetical protein
MALLPVGLLLQLADGALLCPDFRLQFRDLVALDLDERLQTSGMRITGIASSIPRGLKLSAAYTGRRDRAQCSIP